MITTRQIKQFIQETAAPLIGHTEDKKHIFRKGVVEFLEGLTDEVNYPALLIEQSDFSYEDGLSDNIMKTRKLAFMVVDHAPDAYDTEAIDVKQEQCEIIADKILNKLQEAKHYPQSDYLHGFSFNNAEGSEIRNMADSNYGVMIEITLSSYHNQYE